MTTTTKNKTPTIESIEDINALLRTAQDQPDKDREVIAARLSTREERTAQPVLPDIDGYVAAQCELPVLRNIIEDIDRLSPDIRRTQAGDECIVSLADKPVAILREDLTKRVENKKSALERIGEKVGSYAKETISALTRASAADAEDRLAKAREEAAAIEFAIHDATTSIRSLEISPSLAAWHMAAAAVQRVNIS